MRNEDGGSKLDLLLHLVLEQSKKLESSQQLLQVNPMVNSDENDISSELDTIILDQTRNLMAGSTANTYRKNIQWYKDKFGEDVKNQQPDAVLLNIFKFILDSKNSNLKASTKRCLLVNFYGIICALDAAEKISPEIEKRRKKINKILQKAETKEHAQGLCKGWIAFSDLDFRHVFNCIVKKFGGLPLEKLQIILQILLGKVTGRRSGEINWIAASSWKIKFHSVDGKTVPQLTFEYCYHKNNGPGIYTASFMECREDSGDVPPVALTLLFLEKKKMIPIVMNGG